MLAVLNFISKSSGCGGEELSTACPHSIAIVLLRCRASSSRLSDFARTLQIILDLCIPEKELAKTRSQISFI
jgi:hypothetical protein